MAQQNGLQRFIDAQKSDYDTALAEVKQGHKRSHWMWYIFPQIQGLGFSEASRYYGIKDINEAEAYYKNPVLGSRLVQICEELLKLPSSSAHQILGSPDDLKLRSCITLFAALPDASSVFKELLRKFFSGQPDAQTLKIIGKKL
ncbi:DUF1810 domain-containing protein [Mucilaginibacter robiniae]|uniref:DUF1810 domain-containing protein n=1 Tax=Mucilaginibacter robiniae TaxID=2728022 RepID=A0A7L5E610_9SPHI|nr:DUF1810 domain-containing protein [Mucilaginibacter robiniae]QJD95806.1 DUF1810 domain-containing protein [Mucilaginibacter robiniae]